MGSRERQFVIGEKELAEISSYCEIAKANRSMITVTELLQLTTVDATEEDLLDAWDENASLSSRYLVESGYIVEKGDEERASYAGVGTEETNRARARLNLSIAGEFARICADGRVRLLAVSGGNSYKSARAQDDIDFFSVTANDAVWIFMLKALVLARIYGLGSRTRAPFCFSYVVEERRAREDFGHPRDGLFARDALMAHVLSGSTYYQSLIAQSRWMERYFPNLYRRQLSSPEANESPNVSRGGQAILNSFLFYTLGTYVRIKALLLNRKLQKSEDVSALFHADVGKDRCIYESNRYKRLRKMYPQLEVGASR